MPPPMLILLLALCTNQGSTLFYFKSRNSYKHLHGVIPMERARIEREPPVGYLKENTEPQLRSLCITITVHVQHAYIAKHPFYVILAPTPEVHAAWVSALRQAAIPRSVLLSKLQSTGTIADVINECSEQTQLCFPTSGGMVISSAACIRLDGCQSPLATGMALYPSPGNETALIAAIGSGTLSGGGTGSKLNTIPFLPIQPNATTTTSTTTAPPSIYASPQTQATRTSMVSKSRASALHAIAPGDQNALYDSPAPLRELHAPSPTSTHM